MLGGCLNVNYISTCVLKLPLVAELHIILLHLKFLLFEALTFGGINTFKFKKENV